MGRLTNHVLADQTALDWLVAAGENPLLRRAHREGHHPQETPYHARARARRHRAAAQRPPRRVGAAARPLGAMRPRERAALLGRRDALDAQATSSSRSRRKSRSARGAAARRAAAHHLPAAHVRRVLTRRRLPRVVIDHADPDADARHAPTCGEHVPLGPSWCSRRATSRSPSASPARTPPPRSPPAALLCSRRTPGTRGCRATGRRSWPRALNDRRRARRGPSPLIAGDEAGLSRAARSAGRRPAPSPVPSAAGRALFDVAAARAGPDPVLRRAGQRQPSRSSPAPPPTARGARDRRQASSARSRSAPASSAPSRACCFVPRGHGLEQALADAVRSVEPARSCIQGVRGCASSPRRCVQQPACAL